MKMPGFTAESSIYQVTEDYRQESMYSNDGNIGIVPAAYKTQVCFPYPCEDIFGNWHVCGICYIIIVKGQPV